MEKDCSYKGKVNIDTEGLWGIWAPPDTLDSLRFQLREEQEVLWQHVKVVFPKQAQLFDAVVMVVENTVSGCPPASLS